MIIQAMLRCLLRLAVLPLLLPVLASAQGDEARAAFAAAYAAPTATAADDSAVLRAYPLYRWLQAARLKAALEFADPDGEAAAQAIAFADAAGEVAHVRDLRRALLSAAAQRGDGAQFLSLWRDSVANDVLRCQRLDARRLTGDTATLAAGIAERLAACTGASVPVALAMRYGAPAIEQALAQLDADGGTDAAFRIRMAGAPYRSANGKF